MSQWSLTIIVFCLFVLFVNGIKQFDDRENEEYETRPMRRDQQERERFRERRNYTPNNMREKDAADFHPRFQQLRARVGDDNDPPCSKKEDGCFEAELHSNVPGLMSKDEDVKRNAELQDLVDEIQQKHISIRTQHHWIKEVQKILTKYSRKVRAARKRLDGYEKDLDALHAKKEKIISLKKRKHTEQDLRITAAALQELRSEKQQIEDTEKQFANNEKATKSEIDDLTNQIHELEGIDGASDDDGTGSASGGATGDAEDSDAPPAEEDAETDNTPAEDAAAAGGAGGSSGASSPSPVPEGTATAPPDKATPGSTGPAGGFFFY